jgi:hypothetical protein
MYISGIKDPGIDCQGIARPTSTGVVVSGLSFGASQVYDVKLTRQNPFSSPTEYVVQSVTSWSDTSFTFDVDIGTLGESDEYYIYYDDGTAYPPNKKFAISMPDVHCAAGSFVAATTSGSNVVVSGLDFRPKAIFLWSSAATGESQVSGQGVGFAIGFCGETVNDGNAMIASRGDAASYSTKGNRHLRFNGQSSYAYNSTYRHGAVTPTADGFSVNFSTADTQARIIHWIAFGGRTVVSSHVTVAGSAGYFPFNDGKKHRPDLVLVAHMANSASSATDGPMFGFGAIAKDQADALKQWSIGWSAFSPNTSSSLVHSNIATTAFAQQVYNNAITWSMVATGLAYDSITWSGSDADYLMSMSVFLDGAEVEIGTITKAISATTTSIGALEDPDLAIVAIGGSVKNTVVGHANMGVGAATASHQSHARTWADLVGSLTEGTQASDTAHAIAHYDASGNVIDVGSLSLTGSPTITWDTPRAGTAEIAYLAIKRPVASSSPVSARNIAAGMLRADAKAIASQLAIGRSNGRTVADGQAIAFVSARSINFTKYLGDGGAQSKSTSNVREAVDASADALARGVATSNVRGALDASADAFAGASTISHCAVACAARIDASAFTRVSGESLCSVRLAGDLAATAFTTSLVGRTVCVGRLSGWPSAKVSAQALARFVVTMDGEAVAAARVDSLARARAGGSATATAHGRAQASCEVRVSGEALGRSGAAVQGGSTTRMTTAGQPIAMALLLGGGMCRERMTSTCTAVARSSGVMAMRGVIGVAAGIVIGVEGASVAVSLSSSDARASVGLLGTVYAASVMMGVARSFGGVYRASPARSLSLDADVRACRLGADGRLHRLQAENRTAKL